MNEVLMIPPATAYLLALAARALTAPNTPNSKDGKQ